MVKPTQFWFVNFEPKQNLIFEPLDYVEQRTTDHMRRSEDGKDRSKLRSEIHQQYANRFIRQYLIDANPNQIAERS